MNWTDATPAPPGGQAAAGEGWPSLPGLEFLGTLGAGGMGVVLKARQAALQRDVAVNGRLQLRLRWEVFNVLNHQNFDIPNRIAFTSNFGRIFSALPSRQMQFGVKLTF